LTAGAVSARRRHTPQMGDEMSGGDEPAADIDWVRLRQDYEVGERAIADIAQEAGINRQKLVLLAKCQGWKLRSPARAKTEATRDTIRRLKSMLQGRLGELEAQIATLGAEATAASSEREIRSMTIVVGLSVSLGASIGNILPLLGRIANSE